MHRIIPAVLLLLALCVLPESLSAQSGSLCNVLQANQTPPVGYGAAWHVFFPSYGLLLNSYCNANSTVLKVGISDTPDHYIYKQGYVYTGFWQPFTLSGNFAQGSSDWIQGQASYTYQNTSQGPVYWVGYLCHWDAKKSEWFCGCRDKTCATNYWMLQAFERGGSSGGGGVSGGNDTFACLADFSGPTKSISGNQGYTRYTSTGWSSGTKFDARNATFRSKWNPSNEQSMNILLGGNWKDAPQAKACWAGGTITGENPTNETWCKNYSSNAIGISMSAKDSVVTGMRIHNLHDAIRFTSNAAQLNFNIKDNWITYNRDDCIENDTMSSGIIEDNLFDGCYVFYSAVNVNSSKDGSNNLVKVENNVVRLQAMPGPREVGGSCDAGKTGHGMLWKIADGGSPRLSIKNNVFLLEGGSYPPAGGGWMQGERDDKIVECSNNTVIWAGGGSPPKDLVDGINRHGNCFTLTTDKSIYETAKQQWINRHD